MTVHDLIALRDLTCVQKEFEDAMISGGYTSDLLSDVIAHAETDNVLITIQAHINTVAVSKLVGIRAIVVANGREVLEDVIMAAKKEKIAIFSSALNQFSLSVLIGQELQRA
jgi:hypothetical protein